MGIRWRKSPQDLIAANLRRSARLKLTIEQASRDAGKIGSTEGSKRTWVRSRVSIQDTKSGVATSRVVTTSAQPTSTGAVTKIQVRGYLSSARDKSGRPLQRLMALLASAGARDEMFRRGLWIRRRRNTTPIFIPFAGNGFLQAWALRPDRGQQFYRHKVRIAKAVLLEQLVLMPALAEIRRQVIPVWRRLVERVIGG